MRTTLKLRVALLTLALLLLLGGTSGAVFADGAEDTASVGWIVSAQDGEGNDLTLDSAEEVEAALGKGFALTAAGVVLALAAASALLYLLRKKSSQGNHIKRKGMSEMTTRYITARGAGVADSVPRLNLDSSACQI